MPKLNALVAGSTGYIGVQLIKLLVKHKYINIKYLCGNSSVGKNISLYDKSLSEYKLPKIVKFNKKLLNDISIVFGFHEKEGVYKYKEKGGNFDSKIWGGKWKDIENSRIGIAEYIVAAFDCREINPTSNNKQSSRSHVVVCMDIKDKQDNIVKKIIKFFLKVINTHNWYFQFSCLI